MSMRNVLFICLMFFGIALTASECCSCLKSNDLKDSLTENCKIQDVDNSSKPSRSKINFTRESFERSTLKAVRIMLDAYGLYAVLEIGRSLLGRELNNAEAWREWQLCAIASIIIYPLMYNEA